MAANKRAPRLTPQVRRGLATVWAFCDANNYEGSELLPTDAATQEVNDTQAALDWIKRASSPNKGE